MTSGANRPAILPVLAINLIGTLGYSLILPFLVFLVTRLQGNALVYGLLGATYPAFQLIGAPLLGRWSDVHGRRPVLLLSQVGTLLSWIVFGAALFLPVTVLLETERLVLTLPIVVLFVARALDGLTGGNVSVANAYLADITDDEHRSRDFARMALSANIGFVVGPALAGLLGATVLEERLPVLAAILIAALGTWLVTRLREPDPCPADPGPRRPLGKVLGLEQRNCVEARLAARLGTRRILALPGVAFLLVVYFLVFLGFNLFYTAFPVHAARTLAWSIPEVGTFFMALSLLMVLVQGPLLSSLAGRFSERTLIVVGSLLLAASFAVMLSAERPLLYTAAALFALGNGVMWPSVMAVLARIAGDEAQGAVQGLAGAVGGLASVLGLVAGGVLYGRLGATTFLASGGILLVVAVLATRLPHSAGTAAATSDP